MQDNCFHDNPQDISPVDHFNNVGNNYNTRYLLDTNNNYGSYNNKHYSLPTDNSRYPIIQHEEEKNASPMSNYNRSQHLFKQERQDYSVPRYDNRNPTIQDQKVRNNYLPNVITNIQQFRKNKLDGKIFPKIKNKNGDLMIPTTPNKNTDDLKKNFESMLSRNQKKIKSKTPPKEITITDNEIMSNSKLNLMEKMMLIGQNRKATSNLQEKSNMSINDNSQHSWKDTIARTSKEMLHTPQFPNGEGKNVKQKSQLPLIKKEKIKMQSQGPNTPEKIQSQEPSIQMGKIKMKLDNTKLKNIEPIHQRMKKQNEPMPVEMIEYEKDKIKLNPMKPKPQAISIVEHYTQQNITPKSFKRTYKPKCTTPKKYYLEEMYDDGSGNLNIANNNKSVNKGYGIMHEISSPRQANAQVDTIYKFTPQRARAITPSIKHGGNNFYLESDYVNFDQQPESLKTGLRDNNNIIYTFIKKLNRANLMKKNNIHEQNQNN
jgi:hypothetical protein